jgi:hypothetical protein
VRADTPEQFSPAHMRERVLGGMHRTQFARSPAKHFRRDLRSADACIRFGPSSNQAVSGDPLKPVHKSFVESGLRLAGYSQRIPLEGRIFHENGRRIQSHSSGALALR